MKSVIQGIAAAVAIAIVAGIVLNIAGQSSAARYSTVNTRL